MYISEFVSKYLEVKQQPKQKGSQAKPEDTFINNHIKTHYVSYVTKIEMSKSIVKLSMYKNVNDKKVFVPNSPQRYCLFVQAVIDLYTDLEWDMVESGDVRNISMDFDLLEQNGLVEALFSSIGEDVSKFTTVLNMVLDDEVDQNRSMIPFLETKFEAMSIVFDNMFGFLSDPGLKDKVENFVQNKLTVEESK